MIEEISSSKAERKVESSPMSKHEEIDKKSRGREKIRITEILKTKLTIRINKPLLPLKGALFLWFGAGASMSLFLQVYLKQKGLSIAQISFIYILLPFLQFIGSVISGVIADKIGRSKPVLLGNLALSVVFLSTMLLIPKTNVSNCEKDAVSVTCNPNFIVVEGLESCNNTRHGYCESYCLFDEFYYRCKSSNGTFCSVVPNNITYSYNVTLITYALSANESKISCYAETLILNNKKFHLCETFNQNCNLTCYIEQDLKMDQISCSDVLGDNSTFVFCMSLVLLILFQTVVTTTYRMFDFTTMSMVKVHNSDFGRERFWSIAGAMVFPITSAYAVTLTTKEGSSKNYNTAIYLFDSMAILAMLVVRKLDVKIEKPGKQMIKKTLTLIKNPDIAAFSIAVLILGTCWCFGKQFFNLYLDKIGAPSLLLGINSSLGCLFGLPFLLSSNYFVDKLGSGNMLILGFVGHTIYFVGYAYLANPWWSIILEPAGILNYSLLWVAVIRHSHSIAPEGLPATVISTAGALHFAAGKGTGSMIGGLAMSKYGGQIAFKLMAAISGSAGVLYALYLYARRSYSKKRFETSPSIKNKVEIASYLKTEAAVYSINMSPTLSK